MARRGSRRRAGRAIGPVRKAAEFVLFASLGMAAVVIVASMMRGSTVPLPAAPGRPVPLPTVPELLGTLTPVSVPTDSAAGDAGGLGLGISVAGRGSPSVAGTSGGRPSAGSPGPTTPGGSSSPPSPGSPSATASGSASASATSGAGLLAGLVAGIVGGLVGGPH